MKRIILFLAVVFSALGTLHAQWLQIEVRQCEIQRSQDQQRRQTEQLNRSVWGHPPVDVTRGMREAQQRGHEQRMEQQRQHNEQMRRIHLQQQQRQNEQQQRHNEQMAAQQRQINAAFAFMSDEIDKITDVLSKMYNEPNTDNTLLSPHVEKYNGIISRWNNCAERSDCNYMQTFTELMRQINQIRSALSLPRISAMKINEFHDLRNFY